MDTIGTIVAFAFSFGITAILAYLAKRYGPVNHTWLNIPAPEQANLERLHDEYLRSGQAVPGGRPAGAPIYERALVSHDGLAIYPTGMYAKFSLGRTGKYQFRRFEELSGIYPVVMENPFTTQDSALMGLKSWKELQLETRDCQVFLIDSRRHDFDVVVPILKERLGGEWNRLYREGEVLRHDLRAGYAGWHSAIRPAGPGPATGARPATPYPGAPAAAWAPRVPVVPGTAAAPSFGESGGPVGKDTGRGALLFEEPLEHFEKRRSKMYMFSWALGLVGVLFFGLAAFFQVYPGATAMCLFSNTVIAIVGGAACLILGMMLARLTGHLLPIRLYQNGLTNQIVGTAEEIFIPYGQVARLYIKGADWLFETKDQRYNITLSMSIPGLDRHIEAIRPQIGRPELDYPFEAPVMKATLKRLEYIVYGLMVVLSTVLAGVGGYLTFSGMGTPYVVMGFGILFSISLMYSTFLAAHMFLRRFKKDRVEKGIDLRAVGALFIVALLVFFSTTFGTLSFYTGSGFDARQDPMPASHVSPSSLSNGTTVELSDNLVVSGTDRLSLSNMTMVFNCSRDKGLSVWVGPKATLELYGCLLRPRSRDLSFAFEIHGSAVIADSTIHNVWGDPAYNNGDGGIEVYSSAVEVRNCTITGGRTNGLMAVGCDPLFLGNNISGCGDDGIELERSNATVENNTLSGNEWGMVVNIRSNARITGNLFLDNHYGLAIESPSPVVENNTFAGNRGYGLSYGSGSHPTLSNNRFEGNGRDIEQPEEGGGDHTFEMCAAAQVLTAVLLFVFLYSRQRRDFGGAGKGPST